MRVIRSPDSISGIPKLAITLGNFDGMHLAHQKLIERTHKAAYEKNLYTAALTFEPHPVEFFSKTPHFRLFSVKDKLKLFRSFGLEYVFMLDFNEKLANMYAEDFMQQILLNQIKPSHIVVGYDFVFGKNKSGNSKLLHEFCLEHNIGFDEIPKFEMNNSICSSSAIRNNLLEGKIEAVNDMLGFNYFIEGKVEKGQQIARQLGFPTANIKLKNTIIPRLGVYAIAIILEKDNIRRKAIANIGMRPTFGLDELKIEAHIFDFNKDIYGQKVKIELLQFIRPEMKFPNAEALKLQIAKDIEEVKQYG